MKLKRIIASICTAALAAATMAFTPLVTSADATIYEPDAALYYAQVCYFKQDGGNDWDYDGDSNWTTFSDFGIEQTITIADANYLKMASATHFQLIVGINTYDAACTWTSPDQAKIPFEITEAYLLKTSTNAQYDLTGLADEYIEIVNYSNSKSINLEGYVGSADYNDYDNLIIKIKLVEEVDNNNDPDAPDKEFLNSPLTFDNLKSLGNTDLFKEINSGYDFKKDSKIVMEYELNGDDPFKDVIMIFQCEANGWWFQTDGSHKSEDGIIEFILPADWNSAYFQISAWFSDVAKALPEDTDLTSNLTINSINLYLPKNNSTPTPTPSTPVPVVIVETNNALNVPTEVSATAIENAQAKLTGFTSAAAATNAVRSGGDVKIDAAQTGGVSANILTAMAATHKPVTLTAKYPGMDVKISNKNITNAAALAKLDFSAGKSPITKNIADKFPDAAMLKGVSFKNTGDFGGVDSVTIKVKLDRALINKTVEVFSIVDGKLVSMGTTFVGATGSVNIDISDYNPLVIAVLND